MLENPNNKWEFKLQNAWISRGWLKVMKSGQESFSTWALRVSRGLSTRGNVMRGRPRYSSGFCLAAEQWTPLKLFTTHTPCEGHTPPRSVQNNTTETSKVFIKGHFSRDVLSGWRGPFVSVWSTNFRTFTALLEHLKKQSAAIVLLGPQRPLTGREPSSFTSVWRFVSVLQQHLKSLQHHLRIRVLLRTIRVHDSSRVCSSCSTEICVVLNTRICFTQTFSTTCLQCDRRSSGWWSKCFLPHIEFDFPSNYCSVQHIQKLLGSMWGGVLQVASRGQNVGSPRPWI